MLQRRAGAGALGAEGRAGLDVVALVGDVVWVAEDESGADCCQGRNVSKGFTEAIG